MSVSGDRMRFTNLRRYFLPLLDFVSRASLVAEAFVVALRPLTQVSENHCIDPGQILWEATHPSAIFPDQFFKKFPLQFFFFR